ncbi:MAG: ribonuclease HII [Hyphomicrobiaceae bacterium]
MPLRDSLILPTFDLEAATLRLHGGPVAGVDEAGRGPLAGPVVAAAVILDPGNIPPGLADSKQLDADAREIAFGRIMAAAVSVGIGVSDAAEIDRLNILQATLAAMRTAVGRLSVRPNVALVDGNRLPRLDCRAQAVVRGDALCLSIAAASIVAKVTRDRMMIALGREFPGYGFGKHKGYPTPEHHAAIRRLGVTAHHRRSFRTVQLALGLDPATGAHAAIGDVA